MPIPIPAKDETKDKFIGRCMAFTVGTEKRPQDQAYAICIQKWQAHLDNKQLDYLTFATGLRLIGLF